MASLLRLVGPCVVVVAGCASHIETAAPSDTGSSEVSAFVPCAASSTFPALDSPVAIASNALESSARGGVVVPGTFSLREARRIGRGGWTAPLATARELRFAVEISDVSPDRARVRITQSVDGEAPRNVAGTLRFDAFGGLAFSSECGPPSILSPGLFAAKLGYTGTDAELQLYVDGTVLVLSKAA